MNGFFDSDQNFLTTLQGEAMPDPNPVLAHTAA
jgi:hypothetical protein